MGCGPGTGGALMDDLIYHRLWLVEDDDKKDTDNEESDHDIRKLFPKKENKKSSVQKLTTKGTPQWLAVSVGVFFIGALFTIGSYHLYSGSVSDQLSHFNVYSDEPQIFDDVPEKKVYNDFKLPSDIVPVSHMLYLSVNIKKRNYSGVIKIGILCKRDTSQIILHSAHHEINHTKIKVKTNENRTISVLNMFRNKNNEMIIITLNDTLTAGSKYNLLFGFHANLTYDYNNGIYLTQYKDGNGNKRDMVSTDFEAIRARKAYPCFDEPELKATWKIILHTTDKGYHALSNMPVEKIKKLSDGTYEVFYQVTPAMSSYLVSIVFTEYVYQKATSKRGVKVRVYAPIGRLNETNLALKYALFAVDYYSKAFGIEYMLPKLDLYPVTKFSAGADETWGNIVFTEDSLLLDPQTSTQYNIKWVCSSVSHEIAHQWFGNLVSIKWWNDLWLKESFAEYLQNLPVAEQYSSWDTSSSAYDLTMTGFAFDCSQYTHPIALPAIEPKKLQNYYDGVTYQKGSSVVNMIARFIGNEKFMKGLQIYLKRYSYSCASVSQLWEALSEAAEPINVVEIMNTWVSYSGYPVVTIKRDGSNFLIEQERFLYKELSKDTKKNVDSPLWQVPMHIKMCDQVTRHLLTSKKGKFNTNSTCDSSQAYKANYGSSGYYHVNYTDDNWFRLLMLMNRNHMKLSVVDRSSLLFDVYALVSFNYVDITLALNFTQYLWREYHPTPWGNGMMIMNRIRHVFYHTKLKDCVEQYTLDKLSPVLDYLNTIPKHTHQQITLIQMLLSYAAVYDMQPLSTLMMNKFLRWIVSDGKEKLPVNTRYQILNAGIFRGTVFEFEYVNKTRQNAKSVGEQNKLLYALARTKDKKLLRRIVDEAERTLSAIAFVEVCYNRHGRDMAWEAFKKHWTSLCDKYETDKGMLPYALTGCLSSGTNMKDLKEAQNFMKNYKLGRFKVYVQRAIEKIKHNIDFARHEKKITSWFRKHVPQCYVRSSKKTEFTFHDNMKHGRSNLKQYKM